MTFALDSPPEDSMDPHLLAQVLSETDDRTLLDRYVQQSDEHAFGLLVDRHGGMVTRICRAVTRDSHAADDAYQATFLVLARRCSHLKIEHSLTPWLSGVAYRCAQRARSQSHKTKSREHELDCEPTQLSQAEFRATHREMQAILHEEIGKLPAELRTPLLLCYVEEMTNEEASSTLNWPVGTVKTRLARGRSRLRSRLAKRGIALSLVILLQDLARHSAAGSALSVKTTVILDQTQGRVVPPAQVSRLHKNSSMPWKLMGITILAIMVIRFSVAAWAEPPAKTYSVTIPEHAKIKAQAIQDLEPSNCEKKA